MPDRTQAPVYNKPEIFALPQVSGSYLTNGVPYFGMTSGNQAAVKLELVFKGGHLNEPSNGLSFFTAKMLTAGTKSKTAAQIEEAIASYGAFIEIGSGYDQVAVTVYCLDKFLREVSVLLAELIREAVFPEEEFQNLKNIQLQNIRVNMEKTSYLASVNLRSRFFENDHPYSRLITEDVIEAIDRKDLLSFYPELFRLSNCTIFVAGGRTDCYSVINEIFGNISVEPLGRTYEMQNVSYGAGVVYKEKEGVLQSTIRLAIPIVGLSHPDYPSYALLNEIFGGYFGSRLMKNIREDKGYSYGIHSSMVNHLEAAYMVCGTDVNKEVRESTINEIYAEIDRLCCDPVSEGELETVKNYMLGSYLNSVNTSFAVLEKFKTLYYYNLPATFYEDFYTSVNGLTSQNLLDLSTRFFDKTKILLVSVG